MLKTQTTTMPPLPLQWPEEISAWVDRHEPLVSKLSHSFTTAGAPLTLNHLWETIASCHSPEWVEARGSLRAAEKHLASIMSPENMPLGLIGHALDSAETTDAEDLHLQALAYFTIIDETLRSDDDLQKFTSTLRNHLSLVETSLKVSFNMLNDTHTLDTLVAADERHISKTFKSFAIKLFKKPQAPEKAQILTPDANNFT